MLSIIIATFNSEKTIYDALESVISQKFQDWECIVVDGHSKDSTIRIVDEFKRKDTRIKYISEPDKGVYDAFNKGLNMASGEWIYYLGSDDKLTNDGLYHLMQYSSYNVDIISGHCYVEGIDESTKEVKSIGFSGCHQGKVTRTETLKEYKGFNLTYKILADLDLMIRMEHCKVKIMNVNTFVAYFSSTGISHNIDGLFKRGIEYYNICKSNHISFSLYKTLYYSFIHFRSYIYRTIRKYCLQIFKNK